jgi:biopolymer transport protein ExbB
MMQFFESGGFFMWPLLLCSMISLAIIIERAFFLRRSRILPVPVAEAVDNLPPQGGVDIVWNVVRHDDSILGELVRTCLDHLRWPKAENIEAIQTKARSEAIRLDRYLVILEIIVGIAPLLGLLGTVSGLVQVFESLHGTEDTTGLARGIAMALNTTVAGLVIAIPSLIFHSYFSKRVENYMIELETICGDLLAKLYKVQEQ